MTKYLDHILIGTPEQVGTVIRAHHQAGTFIAMGPPRPVAPTDPRIRVHIRLRDTTSGGRSRPRPGPAPVRRHVTAPVSGHNHHTRAQVRTSGRRRSRHLPAVTAAVVTALIGVVYATGHILARLTTDALTNAAGTVVGFLAIAALLTALTSGARSRKRHCPGCD
jgi:hypothetical protein